MNQSSFSEARRYIELAIVYLSCLYEQKPQNNQTKQEFINKNITQLSDLIKQQFDIPKAEEKNFSSYCKAYIEDLARQKTQKL